MGILNVTPDSFSDGGQYLSPEAISNHVATMVADGADIIDIGGESTRPSAEPVSEAEELRRVIPAIQLIRRQHHIPISIDTSKAEIARQAVKAGATIINDISALRFDPQMVSVLKESQVPVIIMHMQGSPKDMQTAPTYGNVIEETIDFFRERLSFLARMGISKEQIIIDPGLGFGKTLDHNLSIMKHLTAYKRLGCPLLIGHSRKAMIGALLGDKNRDRDPATAALSAILTMHGATIIRVHNVALNRQAITMAQAVMAAA